MNELSKAAAILGKKGGESGTGTVKSRSTAMARAAAMIRWADPEGIKHRFWAKVKIGISNECWPWTRRRLKIVGSAVSGYGMVGIGGRVHLAHRIAFMLTHGSIDDTKDCCHSCDNPCCCNPNHLFMGTTSENILDSVKKGRYNRPKGVNTAAAKLTEEDVRQIRALWATGNYYKRDLARRFNVSDGPIYGILKGHLWKHVK